MLFLHALNDPSVHPTTLEDHSNASMTNTSLALFSSLAAGGSSTAIPIAAAGGLDHHLTVDPTKNGTCMPDFSGHLAGALFDPRAMRMEEHCFPSGFSCENGIGTNTTLLPLFKKNYSFPEELVPEKQVDQPRIAMPPTSDCGACGTKIAEDIKSFFLIGQQSWHLQCVRCCICAEYLANNPTCFNRDGLLYCRRDYTLKFINKTCDRCGQLINAGEMIMHAGQDRVYHLQCFRCTLCENPLRMGEMFVLGAQPGTIFCHAHYDLTAPPVQITDVPRDYVIKRQSSDFARDSSTEFCDRSQFIPLETSLGSGPSNSVDIENQRSGSPTYLAELGAQNHRPMSTTLQHSSSSNSLKIEPIQQQGMPSAEMTPNGFGDCGVGDDDAFANTSDAGTSKTKRLRTSFKHHQLRTMKTYFNLNHNPDAKDLKQLAQKTGLTKRVLQVWFQNARAKFRRAQQNHRDSGGSIGCTHNSTEPLHPAGSNGTSSACNSASSFHPGGGSITANSVLEGVGMPGVLSVIQNGCGTNSATSGRTSLSRSSNNSSSTLFDGCSASTFNEDGDISVGSSATTPPHSGPNFGGSRDDPSHDDTCGPAMSRSR
ncbi:LIM domain-containing protein [Ditylenchus destructor]|uniref:LIM domain-containing protein n=1 Tax=Ditylenchus destructor TaxID=166010 RepID=A0AAD4N5P3_9BILA|nr:LIM domain-containing protein [Ditylenchus destructor]